MLQAGSVTVAPDNMRAHFMRAGPLVKEPNICLGAPIGLALVDEKVLIGKRRNLRKMGHAQTCWPLAQRLQLLAYASAARPPMPISISSNTSVRGVGNFFFGLTAPSSTLTLKPA